MIYKTFGELKTKVQQETDTEAEDFVTSDEIKRYFQEAVDECAAQIYKIWPLATNYFEKLVKYNISVGQQEVLLPDDMYARAITRIVFNAAGKVQTVKRLKDRFRYETIVEIVEDGDQGDYYKYIFNNDSATAANSIQVWPSFKEGGTNALWLWYVRQPIQIVDDSSLIDIPEFYYYITAYVKHKIYDKEGSVRADDAKAELENKKQLMLDTLAEMTPDEDNIIEPDLSFYHDMA